jgi:hypothetical protein
VTNRESSEQARPLEDLNPFNYSLKQLRVALLQLVSIGVFVAGFFVFLNPGTKAAYQAVVVAIFSVIGVFMAKNSTTDSYNKSLTSLLTSVVGVVNLYTTVQTTTVNKFEILIGGLVSPMLVLFNQNARGLTKPQAKRANAAVAGQDGPEADAPPAQ